MRLIRAFASAAVLSVTALAAILPAAVRAQVFVGISVNFAPPALPVYEQPPIPEPGYLWIPGYWAWDDDVEDYYWVPGTWAEAPEPGLLWTPAWWGWSNGVYAFHEGYWGAHVGFYGGVAYGFGYNGSGYEGGYWQNNHFFYNSTVNNIRNNVNITNVYSKTVIVNNVSHVSFNGPGGVSARPTPQQMAAAQEPHRPPTAVQVQHIRTAAVTPSLRASANHGAPPIAAAARPAAFNGPGVVRAAQAGGAYHPSSAPPVQRQGDARPYQGPAGAPVAPRQTPQYPGYGRPSASPPAYGEPSPQGRELPRAGETPPNRPAEANRGSPPAQQRRAGPPPRPPADHAPPPPKAPPPKAPHPPEDKDHKDHEAASR